MPAVDQRLSQDVYSTTKTPLEEPEGMEEEACLLDAFTKVPTLSRGWAHAAAGPDGGVRVMLQFAQRNLPENSQRKFMTQFNLNERVLEHGTVESSMPMEIGNATLVSPSPSGQAQVIVRPGAGSDTSSIIEIWSKSRLTLELHVPEAVHGTICNDGWFGIGAAWSPDETLVAYVAESPINKRTPEWGTRAPQSEESDGTKKKAAGPKGWRGIGEYLEDWGELNTGKRQPTLFVLNIESGNVEAVQGLPRNTTFGQPVWSPDGSHLIFVSWEHQSSNFPLLPQRLGIVYCFNRPCSLFAIPWPQSSCQGDEITATRITPLDVHSAYSPRFTPDGKMLLFLSQRLAVESGVHNATPALLSLPWPKVARLLTSKKDNIDSKQGVEDSIDGVKAETIVGEVWEADSDTDFPGLYSSLLPDSPCLAGSNILLTTVQWRSTTAVVAVNLRSGEVTRIIIPHETSSSSSWTLVAMCKTWIIASESHPGQVCKLFACNVKHDDLENPGSWQWSHIDVPTASTDNLPQTVKQALSSIKARVLTCKPSTGGEDDDNSITFEAIVVNCEKQKRPLPTLVMPHGGPHTCYGTQYFMPSSYLAALGYCLVLVNYRGSTGFGEKSIQSLPGHISSNDVADCMSALCAAKEAGYVDPDRVAVIGGSHGGFLAAHLAGQHSHAFRAVVLRNPVCNIATMVSLTDIPDWCFIEAWGVHRGKKRAGANPSLEDLEKFESVSPIAHVDKVVAPVLMLLGNQDRRVPLDDPKRYLDALRQRDRELPTRIIVFPKDSHALDKPQTEFEQWITTAWWLKKHMPMHDPPPS